MASGERRILVVEDNVAQARLLEQILPQLQPWQVTAMGSAEEAMDWLRTESLDAALVDLGLPGMDGYQLCVRMRTFFQGPILILSVENREHFKQRALARGADGILMKPARPDAIASRLRALMLLSERMSRRRAGPASADPGSDEITLALGGLSLCGRTRTLQAKNGGPTKTVHLTPSEASLLEALSRVPGKLVCRDDLHYVVSKRPWDGRSTLVDFHLHGLRRKLELLGGPATHGVEIRAVYGEGYTLSIGQATTPWSSRVKQ